MAIITEAHKETAKMFEVICGSVLARIFIEQLENDKVMENTDMLKNVDDVDEALAFVRQFADNAEKHNRNAKLLNDVKDGKYRLLFTALAAGMDEAETKIRKNMTDEDITKLMNELKEGRNNG